MEFTVNYQRCNRNVNSIHIGMDMTTNMDDEQNFIINNQSLALRHGEDI
jgi:hypothetical protein